MSDQLSTVSFSGGGGRRRRTAVCSLALLTTTLSTHGGQAFIPSVGICRRPRTTTSVEVSRITSDADFENECTKYLDAAGARRIGIRSAKNRIPKAFRSSRRAAAAAAKVGTRTELRGSKTPSDGGGSTQSPEASGGSGRRRKKQPSSSSSSSSSSLSKSPSPSPAYDFSPVETLDRDARKTAWERQKVAVRRRPTSVSEASGARVQRMELVNHGLLTKKEDLDCGERVVRATKLRAAMKDLVEERRLDLLEEQRAMRDGLMDAAAWADASLSWPSAAGGDGGLYSDFNEDDTDMVGADAQSMSELGVYGGGLAGGDDDDDDEYALTEHKGFSIMEREQAAASEAARNYVLVDEGSRFNRDPIEADLRVLTDEDILVRLGVPGGRSELRAILADGKDARDTLMRFNIRLVVNISKKWIKRFNNEGLSLSALYVGGWDRPSLDEVVQEGFVGLARAVDKYDPSRGLRFSTYATHWITSYVRQTFQKAVTGCLRVPSQLHDIRLNYKKLMKKYYDESKDIPDGDAIAAELGVTRSRLETSLRVTEKLLSIDQPVHTVSAMHKGSGAGGDLGDNELLITDILRW